MMILGPLVWPRTSAVTETLASALASVVTESPSTSSTAGSESFSPSPWVTLSISTTSPTATFCCVPPLRTIAYTTGSSLGTTERGRRTSRRRSILRSLALVGQNGGIVGFGLVLRLLVLGLLVLRLVSSLLLRSGLLGRLGVLAATAATAASASVAAPLLVLL